MKVLVDSDIIIDFLSNQKSAVDFFKSSIKNKELFISVISWAEIVYGFKKNRLFDKTDIFQDFLESFAIKILSIDTKVCEEYVKIKIDLENKRIPLDDFDLLIAATAMSGNLVLATRNIKHFARLKTLKIISI